MGSLVRPSVVCSVRGAGFGLGLSPAVGGVWQGCGLWPGAVEGWWSELSRKVCVLRLMTLFIYIVTAETGKRTVCSGGAAEGADSWLKSP